MVNTVRKRYSNIINNYASFWTKVGIKIPYVSRAVARKLINFLSYKYITLRHRRLLQLEIRLRGIRLRHPNFGQDLKFERVMLLPFDRLN